MCVCVRVRVRACARVRVCVSMCVRACTYRCIIDADYSTGRTSHSLEIESSHKTNILHCASFLEVC